MQEVAHASRLALAFALAIVSPSLHAVALGDVETRSALGEPLDARIPFTLPEGGWADASCFALVRDPADGSQTLGEGVLTIERRRGERALRIRTLAPVIEPAVSIRVRAACPGASTEAGMRQYIVLLDPRPGSALAAISAPAVGPPGSGTRGAPSTNVPPITAQVQAREGDTLETVAAKIYPRNADARRRYLEALRDVNPSLTAMQSGAAIPAGTAIALPDMRAVARMARAPRAPPAATRLAQTGVPDAARELPQPARRAAPAESRRPRAEPKSPAAAKDASALKAPAEPKTRLAAAPEREAAPPAAKAPRERRAPASRPAPGPAFVLKLSSSEVDLTRSRQIDDRMRAQLRERLLVLDADDQVAAMLSMRNSLRQLEARVAEMQLKLDSMPASLAARLPAAAPTRVVPPAETAKGEPPPPKVAVAPAPAPKPDPVTPPKAEPPAAKVEPPPPAKVEPPPPKVEATPAPRIEPPPAPKAEPPVAKIEPPTAKLEPVPAKPVAAPELRPGTRPVGRTPPAEEGLPEWLWLVAALLVLVAAFIGWRLWRRRTADEPAGEWATQQQAETAPSTVQGAAAPAFAEEPIEIAFEVAPEVRPEVSSDAALATRLPSDSSELRRRYIEERFPEVQNRTVVLEDPVSVVKGARLFYEDGALSRAIELLQFAVEDKPSEVRPWLALFEIFRLERLTGEFAELARRFREHHGKSEYWRKVQFFGREIDRSNALYREEPLNTLETIGPREAKRLAAGLSIVGPAATFDPIAENWLNAPMDFENEVLANELRRKLMSEAALTDEDLVPNPMPALRSVEMFTVA